MNETAVAVVQAHAAPKLSHDQIDLIKRTVARGVTDEELQLFLYTAARTGLDPLARQIHAVKRYSGKEQREVMSIQTGIDGYRLIAERTGNYAPGAEPKYAVDEASGELISSTAYVKKLVSGTWHEVAATAFWAEYVQTGRDGTPTPMWLRMPRLMLGKCAEALALRRAFPAEMSGVYTNEEMAQADNGAEAPATPAAPAARPTQSRRPALPAGEKARCPLGHMAGPSQFPKPGATHYCGKCRAPFEPPKGEEISADDAVEIMEELKAQRRDPGIEG